MKLTLKMLSLLQDLQDAGGRLDASDGPSCEVADYCDDGDPDTFNRAIALGIVRVTHDNRFDTSTAHITEAGRLALQST